MSTLDTADLKAIFRLPPADAMAYLKAKAFDEPLEIPSPINEERILEFRIMPYTDDQSMMVVRDVTHLKSLDAMRKNFVANVSHELRTPLTVLKGYLEMTEELPGDKAWEKMHKVMLEQTLRMDTLVNQLLVLSRIEAAPGAAWRTGRSTP